MTHRTSLEPSGHAEAPATARLMKGNRYWGSDVLSTRAGLDPLFRKALAAIDAGDLPALERLLVGHPRLATDRLSKPGAWLRAKVGNALDGFFERPYLLWFVAEDPVRAGTLPTNIVELAGAIIATARRNGSEELQKQLDHALRLVSWSSVARRCGVQIALIDLLVDAGASPAGDPDSALVNGHVEAAAHLVARGAPLTLGTALCLGRWDAVAGLVALATPEQRQFGFILAALNGNAEAMRRMLAAGVAVNAPSEVLYSHATALHHAVGAGSLEAVTVLVEAGADIRRQDTAWHGTPLGWAEHYAHERRDDPRGRSYEAIVAYLQAAEKARPANAR